MAGRGLAQDQVPRPLRCGAPDRFHNAPAAERAVAQERYTELNAAFTTLREPKDRLQHLLELESGAKPGNIQSTPPELTDLFFAVGQLCRDVDFFLLEKGRANSPLLKVKMFRRAMEWTNQLNALQTRLRAKRGEVETELQALNDAWLAAPVGARGAAGGAASRTAGAALPHAKLPEPLGRAVAGTRGHAGVLNLRPCDD